MAWVMRPAAAAAGTTVALPGAAPAPRPGGGGRAGVGPAAAAAAGTTVALPGAAPAPRPGAVISRKCCRGLARAALRTWAAGVPAVMMTPHRRSIKVFSMAVVSDRVTAGR